MSSLRPQARTGPSQLPTLGNEGSETATGVESSSNRFTLTDYVYDREDEPGSASYAIAGPSSFTQSSTARALPPVPIPTSTSPPFAQLPPGAAPAHTFDDSRPSSWAQAVTGEIAQIRASTLPSAKARDRERHPIVVYPPPVLASRASHSNMTSGSRPRQDASYFPHTEANHRSHYPTPTSSSPGPQLSPADKAAIKRLPTIPTSPSALPPTFSSSSSTIPQPRPDLTTTLSSTSLTSSLPSPLLPAFQLTSSKLTGSRPSLATMPSSSSRGNETELDVLPALTWDDPDRHKNISFSALDEKGRDVEGDKEGGGRFRSSKADRGTKKSRILDWIFPDSLYCRLLLGTVIFELVIDLIIEANILWRFNTEVNSSDSTAAVLENKRRLPIFLIIFGLAHLWQLLLTMIAIRTKNTIQISAITIFNFAFLAWAVIQVSELRQILGDLQTSLIDDAVEAGKTVSRSAHLLNLPLNVLTAVIIGVVSVCCLVLSVLAYFVRKEFGWQRYRFLGADLQIRGYYRRFQVLECLIYFAAFFAAGFGIQFIWLVLQKTDAEYIITWIMFPLSLILLVIGRTAAKYENKPFMIFFVSGLTLGQAYFIFKLVRIWQQNTTVYANVNKSLTVFAILSLLSLTACAIGSVLVYRDFGKGLKGAVLAQPKSQTVRVGFNRWRSGAEEEGAGLSAAQKRLSID